MARSASASAKRLKAKGEVRKAVKAKAVKAKADEAKAADSTSPTSPMITQVPTGNDVQEDINDAAARTEKEIRVVKNRLHLQQKAREKGQEEDVVNKPLESNNRWGF